MWITKLPLRSKLKRENRTILKLKIQNSFPEIKKNLRLHFETTHLKQATPRDRLVKLLYLQKKKNYFGNWAKRASNL